MPTAPGLNRAWARGTNDKQMLVTGWQLLKRIPPGPLSTANWWLAAVACCQTWAFPDPEPSARSDLTWATAWGAIWPERAEEGLKDVLEPPRRVPSLGRARGQGGEKRNRSGEQAAGWPWAGQGGVGTIRDPAVGDYGNQRLVAQSSDPGAAAGGRLVQVWDRGQLAQLCHQGISTSCVTVTPHPALWRGQPLLSPRLKISPAGWSLDFSWEDMSAAGVKNRAWTARSLPASVCPAGAEPDDLREKCPCG